MSYGSPQYSNPTATYEAQADGPDVSVGEIPLPLRVHLTAEIQSGQAESEVDAAFQSLIDLVNGSSAFVVSTAAKKYGASVPITVTP
jgi:hypothetical protein